MSGRSSAIGDVTVDSTTTGAHSDVGSIGGGVAGGETSVSGAVASDVDSLEADYDFNRHVHVLRLRILDTLIYYLPELREVGGVRAIPFMQVCCFIMKRVGKHCAISRENVIYQRFSEDLAIEVPSFDHISVRTAQKNIVDHVLTICV